MPQSTFTTVDAGDQFVERVASTWAGISSGTFSRNSAGWTVAQAGRNLASGPQYQLRVALFAWDTSSLPDNAIVASASLVVYPSTGINAGNRNLAGEWYQWDGVSNSDWTDVVGTSAFTYPISSMSIGSAYATVPITGLSGINASGTTYMRLHVDGGEPIGTAPYENYVNIDTTGAAHNPPQLIVNYLIWQTSYTRPTDVGKKKRTQALPI